jgi:hypothetical protein
MPVPMANRAMRYGDANLTGDREGCETEPSGASGT